MRRSIIIGNRAPASLQWSRPSRSPINAIWRSPIRLVSPRPLIRERILPSSTLTGEANLLIFPNLDAANIAFNLVKQITNSVSVGPILIGPAKPAHIVTPSVTARGIVNLAAVAAVAAQAREP